ncbi:MAG: ferritin [Myxococcales bacterium]|nr:ferritin [Myxococcales bacterium]
MPQTPPFHFLQPGRKLTDSELANAMRLDIEAELDAINLYTAHLEATDSEEAKAILRYVIAEEQEHAALFTELVHRLDPGQRERNRQGSGKYALVASGATHEQLKASKGPTVGLTVGSGRAVQGRGSSVE